MKTALVVDDHADTNDMLCQVLRAMGARAVSAFTGEGALAMLGTERPALVVLDVMMPGMDGLEVLRLIRTNPYTATLPVVLYSGVADAEFQRHALGKGANEYLVKRGFDLSELRTKLAKYL
jgi:CheY-like chemotaxis protein